MWAAGRFGDFSLLVVGDVFLGGLELLGAGGAGWHMVGGLWRMAYGEWLMACGEWLMACGGWLMACGEWLMAYGLWLMACGGWLMAYGGWFVDNNHPLLFPRSQMAKFLLGRIHHIRRFLSCVR